MIAQWTGTPGPQEGSGFKILTPVGKSLWPSVTELELGVLTTCHVEGTWDAVPYGSNPLVECRCKLCGSFATESDLGVPMACQLGSAVLLPKTPTTTTYNSSPILQTLTTSVWVVSRYH